MNPARPQRIQIFSVGKRKGDNRKSPWVVRWKVDGKETNRHFPHKTVADRFRQDLDRGSAALAQVEPPRLTEAGIEENVMIPCAARGT